MFDWASNSQNAIITATDPTGTVAANIGTSNARWLTTVSGRLGYAWDRVLLYAKGGGAWVATNSPAISVAGTPASFTSISNTTSSGYTAGFGVEWAFSGNWSVRAEYAYIGLPSQSFTVTPGTPTFGGDVITFSNRNISMVTGAVNYKFGGWWQLMKFLSGERKIICDEQKHRASLRRRKLERKITTSLPPCMPAC